MSIKLFLCFAFKALTVENQSHRGLLTLEEVLKQFQQAQDFYLWHVSKINQVLFSKSIFSSPSVDSFSSLLCKRIVKFKLYFDGNLNSFDERNGLDFIYFSLLDYSWQNNLKISQVTCSYLHDWCSSCICHLYVSSVKCKGSIHTLLKNWCQKKNLMSVLSPSQSFMILPVSRC